MVSNLRKALILTALRVEYNSIRACLSNLLEKEDHLGTVYEIGEYSEGQSFWSVCLTEVGAGNVTAATQVERSVHFFQPEIALFVGVAGGIKDVEIGDVVVATKVYSYEVGKESDIGFLPRPEIGTVSYRLLQRAKAEARRDQGLDFKVLCGAIAAGEKVVGSAESQTAKFLRTQYSDALAVEMEGAGFLSALHAHQRSIDSLVIRGISDLLSGKAKADIEGSQERASRNAAAFAMVILGRVTKFSDCVVLSEQRINEPDNSVQTNLDERESSEFARVCHKLWPLVEANRVIFVNFGPNSGAGDASEASSVRYDLSLWCNQRPRIVKNNEEIKRLIQKYRKSVPVDFSETFERWLLHIEAFRAHVDDPNIDYRDHQFPADIVDIIRENS